MKEEIKEYLDYFKKYATISEKAILEDIEDYITNLQESDNDKQLEIMKLKDKLEQQRKEYQETYKDVRIEIKEKDKTITNLQEENGKLKNEKQEYKDMFNKALVREYGYKLRIDKALELTKELKEKYFNKCVAGGVLDMMKLENILQGEDTNVER